MWFQDIKFKLKGKDIFYIIKVTKYKYIQIKRVMGSILADKILISLKGGETKVNKLIFQFKQLEGIQNEKTARNINITKLRCFTLLAPLLALIINL